MNRSALLRYGLAAGFVLCAAAVALPAEDDFEFADALSRRGYTDLAQDKFNSLINDPKSSPQKRAEGQYGLALLTYADARFLAADRNEKRRKPMEDVLKRFDEADQAFAKFISENPTHVRNLDAKLSRGKLLQDKAEYVNTCIENSWLPTSTGASGWQKQVAEWFDLAIQLFQAAETKAKDDLDRLKADRKDSTPEWDDARDRWGLVWLYRLAALYGKGSALAKGDAAGTASLNQCVKEGTDDYQWEFGESVRGLWAIHFAGLASAALDDPRKAVSSLKGAATFTAEKDDSAPIQDVTFQSYREIGKIGLAFGRREKDDWGKVALDEFAKLPAKWPAWQKHPEGQRAGIIWSRLLVKAGQGEAALKLMQALVKEAEKSNSPARSECTRELGVLLAGGGGGGAAGAPALDPETARKIAMGKWREQDFRGAIAAFQAVIANCDTPEQREKFQWEAWDYIGRCYGASKRYYEAFLAFDQIERAWAKDKTNPALSELTNETAWSRAGALEYVARETKDAADRSAAKQAVEEFSKEHPNAPRNQDADQQNADNKLKDAEALRDDPVAYRSALDEVLKLFAGLKKNVERNAARAAQLHHKQAMADRGAPDPAALDKAIQLADAWLAEKRADTTDSSVRRGRDEGRRIVLAVALAARADKAAALARKGGDPSVKAHQDLLTAIDRFGGEFKDVAANGQAQLDNWRAEGLIGVGKADDADQLVGKLLETDATNRNNVYLAALIGNALERRAAEQKGKEDFNGYKAYMLRSAKRREWVLENTRMKDGTPAPRNPDVLRTIAGCYAEGGEFAKAEALYTEAQKAFEGLSEAAQGQEAKDAAATKARACRIELIGLLVKQGKFDAAIPQLEKEVARDPKARDTFLKAIQKTDAISDLEFKKLLNGTDANKTLLSQLAEAYMKAPSKERLFAAVNLCALINITMEKDKWHQAEYIEYVLRRAEAYLMLGEYSKQVEHYKAAHAAIRSGIVIPGYMDGYEQTLPGAKKRADTVMQRAEDAMRKLGAK